MNIFKCREYEWYQYMDTVLCNINLDEIIMRQDNKIEFIFLNSYNGKECNRIIVEHIMKLDIDYGCFHEGFAYFILDIYVCLLNHDELMDGLSYYRHGLLSSVNDLKSEADNFYLLLIISSDITIEIICGGYEVISLPASTDG